MSLLAQSAHCQRENTRREGRLTTAPAAPQLILYYIGALVGDKAQNRNWTSIANKSRRRRNGTSTEPMKDDNKNSTEGVPHTTTCCLDLVCALGCFITTSWRPLTVTLLSVYISHLTYHPPGAVRCPEQPVMSTWMTPTTPLIPVTPRASRQYHLTLRHCHMPSYILSSSHTMGI